MSLFPGPVDIDIVWAPIFESDRYIDGERLSYFSPAAGGPSGGMVLAGKPEKTLEHGEWALRLSRTIRAVEVALYGYLGRYHQPLGFDADAGVATFPDGRTVTAEKGLAATRVKVYTAAGELETVVAAPDRFDELPNGPLILLDVAVDAAGRVVVLDPNRRQVRVFTPREREGGEDR